VLSRFFARLAISLAMVLLALVAAVTAIVYFAFALYLLLLPLVVPPAAALLTGVLILVAALVLIALARTATRPRRHRRAPSPSLEAAEDAAGLGTELGRKIRGLADAHASGGLLAALVAGFAVGVSPKLRAFLQAILKP
jgi:membrane protein implicated in regulation of membrane protease activity